MAGEESGVIPKNAKRVYHGIIFDVYQWRQRMFDGSYATFERIGRTDTVSVIATQGGRIVIGKERQPGMNGIRVGLISGRLEEGERSLAGAKRELLEETGMVSNDWRLMKTINPSDQMRWTISVFIARNCRKVAEQNLDPGEKIELLRVDFRRFMKIMHRADRYIFGDLAEMKYNRGKAARLKKQIFG